MNSPLIRCPICRDVIEATDEAFDAHIKTHSSIEMYRAMWQRSKLYTIRTFALQALIVLALLAIGIWIFKVVTS